MKKVFITLVLVSAFMLVSSKDSYAQEFSIGVFPPIIQATATPPATIRADITVQNMSEEPKDLTIQFRSFDAADSFDGSISYKNTTSISGPDRLIMQKIQIMENNKPVNSIKLEPLESKTVTLTGRFGKNDPLGDYYFSVIFINTPEIESEDDYISIPAGVATNVLLSVGQKGPTMGQVHTFKTPRFMQHGPVPITLLLKNTGQSLTQARGSIKVQNMFGQTVGKVDLLPAYILSGSYRYMTDEDQASPSAEILETLATLQPQNEIVIWPENFLFGVYRLTADVELGEDGQKITSHTIFFAFPVAFLVGFAVAITIIAGIYLKIKKKI